MPEDAKNLHRILEEDTKFCVKHDIMDYSLLLAVEKFTSKPFINGKSVVKEDTVNAINKEDSESGSDDDE